MMRRPSLILLAIFSACLLPSSLRADEAVRHAELATAHFSLYVESLDAADVGRMLEAYHAQMSAGFAAPPEEPLRVEIYATEARFEAALARDGIGKVEAGGYYSLETRKAYLFVQPSAYFTRQLMLHECTHQYHFLTRTKNRSPRAPWYIEGLAEHWGTHNWDGKTLTLRTVPQMSLEDYPAKALAQFTGEKINRDLDRIVSAKLKVERPVAWALVHFLEATEPEKFRALSAKLDALADPRVAWRETFGEVTPALVDAFEAWIRANQQPWKVAYINWQQRGDRFEGDSDTTAVAVLKETPKSFSVDVESVDRGTQPGIVFDYRSGDDYCTFQLQAGNKVRVSTRRDGKWKPGLYFSLPPRKEGTAKDVLSLRPGKDEGTVSLSANGVEVATAPASGQVGLYVQDGRARFRVAPPSP